MPEPVGPSEQDVRLRELDVVRRDARIDALVVVVHRDREDLLRAVLPDDVLVEDRLDVRRLRDRGRAGVRLVLLDLLRDDVVAEPDALVADVDRGPSDELLHLLLRFPAEGAAQVAVLVIVPPSLHDLPRLSTRMPRTRPSVACSTESSAPGDASQANGAAAAFGPSGSCRRSYLPTRLLTPRLCRGCDARTSRAMVRERRRVSDRSSSVFGRSLIRSVFFGGEDDLVDEAVFLGLPGAQVEVALDVPRELVAALPVRLTRMSVSTSFMCLISRAWISMSVA